VQSSSRMALSDTLLELTRSLIGEPQFTPTDVAARAGVDLDLARRFWRAMGFPPTADDERTFAQSDIDVLRVAYQLSERGVADPGLQLQITRVAGQALARIAEAQVTAALESKPLATLLDADFASIPTFTPTVLPMLELFLTYTWRRHLLAAASRQAAAASEATEGSKQVTVGFADMVGFTGISQNLSERELAAFVDRFEALVYDHVPERGGRVIKMIGDEVMFAVDDVGAVAEIAFGLVTAHSDRPLPPLRVGLALGPVLVWQGDLFGSTVNLASRLVNAARPGTILVSEETAGQLQNTPDLTLRPIRGIELKGIGRLKVFALRRSG